MLANALNEIRLGKVSSETTSLFKSLDRPIKNSGGVEATELSVGARSAPSDKNADCDRFPTLAQVQNANSQRLQRLQTRCFTFDAKDSGRTVNEGKRDQLLTPTAALKRIQLKTGAQVMLIKNISATLVNGTIGVVKGFMTRRDFEQKLEKEDPLESDGLETEMGDQWPLVNFEVKPGRHQCILVGPEEWKIETVEARPKVLAKRTQVPLILAWALSIHKAQGQTVPRLRVDLGRTFECGQAYVALSRATTQDGLEVRNFSPDKVFASERVVEFYQNLDILR